MTDFAPLADEAYKDFREMCIENWYIELLNDDAPLMRLNINDVRVNLVSEPGDNPVQLRLALSGADFAELPVDITKVALFRNEEGGVPVVPTTSIAPILFRIDTDHASVNVTIYQPGGMP